MIKTKIPVKHVQKELLQEAAQDHLCQVGQHPTI